MQLTEKKQDGGARKQPDKGERLAKALRENLKRRKAALRRANPSGGSPP